jgi:phage tail sheath protein FI
VVGVDRPVPQDRYLDQLESRLNVLRAEPRGVLALSAETLSADADLGEIGVRRLLSLLRRVAAGYGQQFVFEPAGPVLSRSVRRRFEALLDLLLSRGALAGAGPDEAYRVTVAGSEDRLVVDLEVAPSVPLRFLSVRLVSTRDGGVALTEVEP